MKTGQLCIKLAGRDAGQTCVVLQVLDSTHVFIDGNTRRKKCNLRHVEPINKTITVSPDASHEDVLKAFKNAGIPVVEHKKGTRQHVKKERPKRLHKQHAKTQPQPAKTEKKKAAAKKKA